MLEFLEIRSRDSIRCRNVEVTGEAKELGLTIVGALVFLVEDSQEPENHPHRRGGAGPCSGCRGRCPGERPTT